MRGGQYVTGTPDQAGTTFTYSGLSDTDPEYTVKNGETITFTQLPAGTYVVTEGDAARTGYTVTTAYAVSPEGRGTVSTENASTDNIGADNGVIENASADNTGVENGDTENVSTDNTGTEYVNTENASATVIKGETTAVTITNDYVPDKGSLILNKIVKIGGKTPTEADYSLVDGDYIFSITGPTSANQQDQVTKYVQITVSNGEMTTYKVADTDTDAAWTEAGPVSGTDGAIVSNLVEGDYVVTEFAVEGMNVSDITGGQTDGRNGSGAE